MTAPSFTLPRDASGSSQNLRISKGPAPLQWGSQETDDLIPFLGTPFKGTNHAQSSSGITGGVGALVLARGGPPLRPGRSTGPVCGEGRDEMADHGVPLAPGDFLYPTDGDRKNRIEQRRSQNANGPCFLLPQHPFDGVWPEAHPGHRCLHGVTWAPKACTLSRQWKARIQREGQSFLSAMRSAAPQSFLQCTHKQLQAAMLI